MKLIENIILHIKIIIKLFRELLKTPKIVIEKVMFENINKYKYLFIHNHTMARCRDVFYVKIVFAFGTIL